MEFSFIVPPQIVFGCGSARCLVPKVRELGGQKPLVVTSGGMGRRDFAKEILASLDTAVGSCLVYSGVPPEPSVEDARGCLEFARQKACDLLVGLGGGSVMDVAKKVALDLGVRKIMVPTTLGTGSEVTHESVLKVDGRKRAFVDDRLAPDVAIVDPDLAAGMSPVQTARSGMDALAHAIECYESKRTNPLVRSLARDAFKLIRDNLRGAVSGDSGSRANVSLGSLMAGMAFGNSGTALCHALSYPLSNDGIPHGEAVAVTLPFALEFNGFDSEVVADVRSLVADLGISVEFKTDICEMAAVVMEDKRHLSNNPREVTYDDVVGIFKRMQSSLGRA
jgi:alcohol dehydrogenase class IV